MNQGNFYFLYHFVCKNCQKEFRQATAYSPPATNLGETYCANCANLKYFNLSFTQSNNNSLSANSYSVHSTNENINPSINSNQISNQEKTNFKEKTNNLNNQNKANKQILEKKVQKLKPNFQPPESTFRDKRITGRTKQLNLRVKEKTYWRLKELALKNRCLMTEMLEKLLEGYEKFYKTK